MKKLLIGLLAFGSVSSFGSAQLNGPLNEKMFNNEVNQEKSYYKTLGDMFKNGSKPQVLKLLDVMWVGRCFRKDDPMRVIGTAIHFRKKKNSGVGALSSEVPVYEAASVWNMSKAPDYYDELSVSKMNFKKYNRAFDSDNSVIMKAGSVIYKLRVSGKYLVEETVSITDDAGPLTNRSAARARCYYFIPEYDHK